MKNFLFFNLVLLLISLFFLGWGEEVVLYTGILFFLLIGIYLVKNNLYLFYIKQRVDLEKEYFLVFFIKSSKLRAVIKRVYGVRILKAFYLAALSFLEQELKRITSRKVFEKCGLIYM